MLSWMLACLVGQVDVNFVVPVCVLLLLFMFMFHVPCSMFVSDLFLCKDFTMKEP